MGLLNVIRALRLRQGLAIKNIERHIGLSRNTINQYLTADPIKPKFATPERASKLDPFADKRRGWLKSNSSVPTRVRHSTV